MQDQTNTPQITIIQPYPTDRTGHARTELVVFQVEVVQESAVWGRQVRAQRGDAAHADLVARQI